MFASPGRIAGDSGWPQTCKKILQVGSGITTTLRHSLRVKDSIWQTSKKIQVKRLRKREREEGLGVEIIPSGNLKR